MRAERETFDRLLAHFLADQVGATFEGHISGVTRAGLFVKLDDTGADGLIPARTVGAEYFRYQEDRHAFVGAETGTTHRLGDPVTVRLVEAAPVAGALRFELLSEGPTADPASRQSWRRGGEEPQTQGTRQQGSQETSPPRGQARPAALISSNGTHAIRRTTNATSVLPCSAARSAAVRTAAKAACFALSSRSPTNARHAEKPLHHHRADDAPAYFVILIVGHLVVPIALAIETAFAPPYWVHLVTWGPVTLGPKSSSAPGREGRNCRAAVGQSDAWF